MRRDPVAVAAACAVHWARIFKATPSSSFWMPLNHVSQRQINERVLHLGQINRHR